MVITEQLVHWPHGKSPERDSTTRKGTPKAVPVHPHESQVVISLENGAQRSKVKDRNIILDLNTAG